MKPSPISLVSIEKERILLAEGMDAKRFVSALLGNLDIKNIQVINFGGNDELGRGIGAVSRVHKFLSVKLLGVLRDAETSYESAFQSVQTAFDNNGLSKPRSPASIEDGTPSTVAFILPDCNGTGCLEDLCISTLETTQNMTCAIQFLKCIEPVERTSANQSKGLMYAYLASCRRPGRRLGEAAEKGEIPFSHDKLRPLAEFLQQMSDYA